jgi:hypothetical protein
MQHTLLDARTKLWATQCGIVAVMQVATLPAFAIFLNLLEPELFFFFFLAHPVYKMLIIQDPHKLEL